MKIRKSREVIKTLQKKGFQLNPNKKHHKFYYLTINGKKTDIYTYFSHSIDDLDNKLLSSIKSQLKFISHFEFENFLDCPLTLDMYLDILKRDNFL